MHWLPLMRDKKQVNPKLTIKMLNNVQLSRVSGGGEWNLFLLYELCHHIFLRILISLRDYEDTLKSIPRLKISYAQ